MKSPPVKITVTLDEPHAWHLAQFLKRVSFTTCDLGSIGDSYP